MRVFPLALCLCLLSGCTGAAQPEAPAPTPAPTLAPIPESEFPWSVLGLGACDVLLNWAAGDLNGDGLDDLAAVVEHRPEVARPEDPFRFWGAPRTLRVLLQREEGTYEPGQENHTLVRTDFEGGMMGEPFEGISIGEKGLSLFESGGGGAVRWSLSYTFAWKGEGLAVSRIEGMENSTHTSNGTTDVYDFEGGTFRRWTYSEEDEAEHRLLWEGPLAREGWPLEEVPDDDGYRAAAALPPLPVFEFYDYGRDRDPVRSAQEVLDQIKEKYYPDMVPVAYPWTEETRANYSYALGLAVPDCWYTDGTGTLSYFWLEENGQHTVIWEETEDSDFYWVWDDTGEEWDFENDHPPA